jgi:hydrogenase small subunit
MNEEGSTTMPESKPSVDEVNILWISEGMSCDGDTVSVTAGTNPSIEDVVLGLIPGLPKVNLHNKVLAYETGEAFMTAFRKAARGELDPFLLVIEGSIPNERINGEGHWSSFGVDLETKEPITLDKWLDALAPRAWAVVAIGTCATYGGIHAMAGNPTGCMGLGDYLGWNFRSKAGIPLVNVPGCPVQPDNFMETLFWLLQQAAGKAPMIPLDEQLRPTWLFGKTVHEGCDRAGYYEQADFAPDYSSPRLQLAEVPGEDRLLGPGRQLQRPEARLDERHRRLPKRRRHLHRLHDAGLPRQVHAVHGSGARLDDVGRTHLAVRTPHPKAPRDHESLDQQRAEVAPQRPGAHERVRPALDPRNHHPPRLTRGVNDDRLDPTRAPSRGDVVGPCHAHHRQPRHLHEDRLRQARGRRVQEHVIPFPRLQRIHAR